MLHEAAMVLMIGSAIVAAACCLGAGRIAPDVVPWQARQSAVVMALGMIALCGGGDARVLLLVAAVGVASAMLGVVRTRGLAAADACFHRALGCVVMALCALAMLSARSRPLIPSAPGYAHGSHGGLVAMSFAAVAGVVVLLGLMLAARMRLGLGAGRRGVRGAPRAVRSGADPVGGAAEAEGGGEAGAAVRRSSPIGRFLLEGEAVAMSISLVVMAAMVLQG